MKITEGRYWWAKCVIAAVSIVVLISVSFWLCEQKGKMCKMLDYLGNHSMEVYIIHAPILILDRNVLSKLIGNVWIYSYFIHNCNYPFIIGSISSFWNCANGWGWLLVGKRQKGAMRRSNGKEKGSCMGNAGNSVWRSEDDADGYGYAVGHI